MYLSSLFSTWHQPDLPATIALLILKYPIFSSLKKLRIELLKWETQAPENPWSIAPTPTLNG